MLLASKALTISSICLLFLAYANFGPTSLSADQIADYVKNHFVREIIFGLFLSAWCIYLIVFARELEQLRMIALIGSIVVLPFWIATFCGWSTGGLADVWGENINANAAYWLHGVQTAGFYLGLILLFISLQPDR